jgi:hypothetical protein
LEVEELEDIVSMCGSGNQEVMGNKGNRIEYVACV